MAIMTSTPDMADIRAVLHDTRKMGAHGGKRLQLAVGVLNQNRRLAAETENLSAVRFHFFGLMPKLLCAPSILPLQAESDTCSTDRSPKLKNAPAVVLKNQLRKFLRP